MRKAFVAGLAACLVTAGFAQDKKEKQTLEGNGNLVTRDVAVTSFSELKASGVYELKLSQGNREGVRIEADENLHDLFQVRNEGSRLVIDMKKLENTNLKTKNKMRVYVTFKQLNNMDLSTVGNVVADEQLSFEDLKLSNRSVGNVDLKFTARKVDISNSSVGNVTLTGKAESAVVKNSSVGSLAAGSFVVQTMDIDNEGVGNAEVHATKELKVKDNALSRVKNKGSGTVRKLNTVRI